METHRKIVEKLKIMGIKYQEIDQRAAKDRSVDELVRVTGMKYSEGMSTLFFRTEKGEYVVILRRDDRNVISKVVKKLSGSKSLNFAQESDLEALGFEAGLVSPVLLGELQNSYDIKVYVDSKVIENDFVICGIAKEGFGLKIKVGDLLKLLGRYEVGEITEANEKRQSGVKKRILTGDRPTGKLHIGHYVGTLKNRVLLQDEYDQFVLIANIHALSDNSDNPKMVKESILELLCDYYAVGIDFDKTTVYIQSEVPEVHEIFMYLSNFATVQQIMHNPTIKTELKQNSMEDSTPLGFFIYPIHQAADILCVNASLVPVGKDQAPMIEDTRELVRKFSKTYGVSSLNEPEGLYGAQVNVPGIDGNEKMGKSLNNAIYLSDSEEELRKKVFKVYTDPNRIRATDPGTVEGNVAFIYHDLFNTDKEEVADLKKRYVEGTVGDVEVKEKLFIAMNNFLTPIREKRLEAESMKEELLNKALEGSKKVRKIARGIADTMKEAMLIKY